MQQFSMAAFPLQQRSGRVDVTQTIWPGKLKCLLWLFRSCNFLATEAHAPRASWREEGLSDKNLSPKLPPTRPYLWEKLPLGRAPL